MPDEFLELSPRLDFIELVEPIPSRFEFVFLGLSKIPEQPAPAPDDSEPVTTEVVLTPEPTSSE